MGTNYDVKPVCTSDECAMGNFRYLFGYRFNTRSNTNMYFLQSMKFDDVLFVLFTEVS